MVAPKSTDRLVTAYIKSTGIRLAHVDVTESARTLERNHLSGPTAGLALADAVAAVALLSMDSTKQDEAVSLRMDFDGPLQGLLVEATHDGMLRGFTSIKVMNDFDGRDPIPVAEALGSRASVQILRSVPGELLEQSSFDALPPTPQDAIRTYMNRSQQRNALTLISSESYGGYIDQSRGVFAERMPDGDPLAFERLRARFDDGTALDALNSAASLEAWAKEVGLSDLSSIESRPLRFGCRCSRERAAAMLAALSKTERAAMAKEKPTVTIFCHMCGASYVVPVEPDTAK